MIGVSYSQEFIIFRVNIKAGGQAVPEQYGMLNKLIQTQIKAKKNSKEELEELEKEEKEEEEEETDNLESCI